MNPKHIKEITDPQRIAKAPYNFVELPEKVVEAEPLPDGDRYHPNKDVELPRHTGRIECTLTTKSKLYTRCGWSPEDFAKYSEPPIHRTTEEKRRWEKEEKAKWEEKRKEILASFFSHHNDKLPVIPGSSIRGLLRTLVEIVSFSKIDLVSDAQKFFFRAVAAEKSDPLKRVYKLENVQAGYLSFDKNHHKWYVYPALILDDQNNLSYLPVKEVDIKRYIRSLIPMKKDNYLPQYIDISFEFDANNEILISDDVQKYPNQKNQGILVTSGNMLETSNLTEAEKETKLKSKKGRKYHYIISKQYSSHKPIEISQEAIFDYISALTNFQNGKFFKDDSNNPFDNELGVLKDGRPIFYCQPTKPDQPITLFGQSPNFRIPYSPQGNGKASTARDFIPHFLKDSPNKPVIIDIAEAIFGFVRRDKQPKKIDQSRAGRVFISDATLNPNQEEKVKSSIDKNPVPILLSSPKPTTFQHYLVQTSDKKLELKHYASKPPIKTEEEEKPGETVIRGHKLYWHKPCKIEVPENSDTHEIPKNSDTQITLVKPIDPEIEFTFKVYFENLSNVELGALLWVLDRADKPEYCLSLGMGKPFGMGAVKVKIDKLWLGDRSQRYNTLFTDNNQWEYGEGTNTESEREECIKAFEDYVLEKIHENDHPEGRKATSLDELPRIKMLLAMLRCDSLENSGDAEYMSIEPNEYKDRRVLPTPLQVADCRRLDNLKVSTSTVIINKPQKKAKYYCAQSINATVTKLESQKKGVEATYEIECQIEGSIKRKEYFKGTAPFSLGQRVEVEITSLKEDGKIQKVKWIKNV